jgi:hypothetical protein
MVSLSVGYNYSPLQNHVKYEKVNQYFETLHPVQEQRLYILKTFARQLFGDTGKELLHIHCGFKGSAGGGKTKSWEIQKLCLGEYVQKFDVSLLVNVKRKDCNSTPSPEYRLWKGKRLLYCTEPNPGETLNSGVLKDITGGEQIVYRLLFSNTYDQYLPQFKIHIMTNDLPKIDGTDEGVKRRIRVVPYVSTFGDKENVDPLSYHYLADTEVTYAFRNDPEMRMEYFRFLLDHYDHTWTYPMTKVIMDSSREYLADNDVVGQFVDEILQSCTQGGFVTLKEIKAAFKLYDGSANTPAHSFKGRLERVLGIPAIEQQRINGAKYRNVYNGFKFKN